jgi:hypothetical protein
MIADRRPCWPGANVNAVNGVIGLEECEASILSGEAFM